jgi:cyanophycinase
MKINRPMFAARACLVALIAVLLVSALSFAVQPGQGRGQRAAPQIGPPNGALVIVGGAMRDPAIRERFIDLAGGPDAPIVVIPTAGGGQDYDEWSAGLQGWKRAGVTDITVLHTKDRAVADSEEFVAPLRRARGVWFNGGRQWHLADSYLDTKAHEELWGVLRRGGVIGGSSAGATIQGSYLARGDTSGNRIMMGDHTAGLGFLKNAAIDQHVLMRNRQFDLIEIIEQRPELLGIGIDENTAIVVRGDSFEVIGQGYVLIHDANAWVDGGPPGDDGPGSAGGSFYFLAPGDSFDLLTREASRPGRESRNPIDRVRKKNGGG